jgi:hypothetical protein
MNYRKVYINIIRHAQQEQKYRNDQRKLRFKTHFEKGIYYELHHILPKSLFPLWNKRKSNLVLLTAREHFFCHQLLTKVWPGLEMACAAWRFTHINHGDIKITSSQYEQLKLEWSKYMSNILKGHTFNKGRKPSLEARQHRSEALKGKNKGKKVYNNGETQISLCDGEQIPEGYVRGQLKKYRDKKVGFVPWNKGIINCFSEETKQKMIASHTGKKASEESKKKQSENMKRLNTWAKDQRWYTNGIEIKKMKECPEDWWKCKAPYIFSKETRKRMSESAKKRIQSRNNLGRFSSKDEC